MSTITTTTTETISAPAVTVATEAAQTPAIMASGTAMPAAAVAATEAGAQAKGTSINDKQSSEDGKDSTNSKYLLDPIVKEPRLCAFCEDMKMSEKAPGFLKIDSTNHVGNIPIVISKRCNDSEWICIVHWEKNKKEWKEKMSHDSFPANPLSVDVLTEVTAQKGSIFCPSDDEEKDPSHTKSMSSKEEHLAELQQKAFKSAAASLPSGVFVSVPAISDCLDYSNLSGLDLNKLSPLFIQFLAWQRLMQINQQMRLMSTNSVDKSSVLKLIQEASNGTVQSHQQNPIIPNYKLSRTTKDNLVDSNNSTASTSTSTTATSSLSSSSSSSILSSASNSKCGYAPLIVDSKKATNVSKADKNEAGHEGPSQTSPASENPLSSSGSTAGQPSSSSLSSSSPSLTIQKRKAGEEKSQSNNWGEGPEHKMPKLNPLDDMDKIKRLESKIPRVAEIRSKVPQKTSYAYVSGYDGHVVLCELNKKEVVIGRPGKKDIPIELDLTGLVENIKKVSHKQCVIEWDDVTKTFSVRCLSKNGFHMDDSLISCNDVAKIKDGSKITIHQFDLVFVIPKDFTHPQ